MNSYLAVAIAALIPMIIGMIWYHPSVFGNHWMKSLGFTKEDLMKGNMGLIYGLALAMAAVIAYRMNGYSSHTEPGMSQFLHGMYHGAVSGGMMAVPVLVMNSLFERRNLTNILVNAAYWIVALGLMGAFLYSVATPEAAPH